MARQSLGHVILTLEQLQWASGAIERRRVNKEQLKSTRERGIVDSLYEKLEGLRANLTEPIILKASRNEARYLQRVAEEVRNRLVLSVIPGYEARAQEKRFLEYKRAAETRVKMLGDIVNKVKAAL